MMSSNSTPAATAAATTASVAVAHVADVLAQRFVSSKSTTQKHSSHEDSLLKMQLRVSNTASVDAATITSCLIEDGGMTSAEAKHHAYGLFALYDREGSGTITWKSFTHEWTRIRLYDALCHIRDSDTISSSSSVSLAAASVARSFVLQSIAHQLGAAAASEITEKLFSERDASRTSSIPLIEIGRWYYTEYGPSPSWAPISTPTLLSDSRSSDVKDVEGGIEQPLIDSIQAKWRNPTQFYGLVFVDDELFIGDMPSGGFAGEYSVDLYTGALKLTVRQHRPIRDSLSTEDHKWMESLGRVNRFSVKSSPNQPARTILLHSDDNTIMTMKEELSDEDDANDGEHTGGANDAGVGGDNSGSGQDGHNEKPKKTKKPSAIVEETEGDDGFDF